MRLQSTTRTALGAAVLGLVFSLVEFITRVVGSDGLLAAIVSFLGDLKWSYAGLVILFSVLLFKPHQKKKGLFILAALCGQQLLFLLGKVLPLFSLFRRAELGAPAYLVFSELLVPAVLLVFALLWRQKPKEFVTRLAALAVVLALVASVFYQVLILGLFDVYTIVGGVSAGFIATWFWSLFIDWKAVEF